MKQPAPWVICPRPYPNELLSSYLVRIAHANGKSPSRFCAFHFPGLPIWNRDVDRNATTAFLHSLVQRTQLSEADALGMTLRNWEAVLTPAPSMLRTARPALAPWINALGIHHRSRHGYGMQYCPRCLAEAGFYRKDWRLSFVTTCPQHACSLLDCCAYCLAPIAFHRNEVLYLHCHHCGRSLIGPVRPATDESEFHIRLLLQQKLLAALTEGRTIIGDDEVPSWAFFLGLSLLLRAVKTRLRMVQRCEQTPAPLFVCPTGQMERLRLDSRVQQCLVMAQLLDDWPKRFLELATDMRLTRRAFDTRIDLPPWIERAFDRLPLGDKRVRRTRIFFVRQELRRIHRHKTTGWRTKRARLLLKMAGIRT